MLHIAEHTQLTSLKFISIQLFSLYQLNSEDKGTWISNKPLQISIKPSQDIIIK